MTRPTTETGISPAVPAPRPRHPWLYALRECRLPDRLACAGHEFTLVETFKHDFFAATGVYRSEQGRLAVAKFGRTNPLLGLPVAWIGRYLTRREVRAYQLLADVDQVPALIGTYGPAAFLHDFVPGHPLGRREEVSDAFFPQLAAVVQIVHNRAMAYVDLNKRQNILMGDDGRPYLIDFQISLWLPRTGWRGTWPAQWLLRRFQHADWYHVLKHKRRLRPDQLTDAERAQVERLSIWIRLHRLVARPLTHLRRALLRRLTRGETETVAGSSAK